ncbi:hypothetical protein ABPG75_001853 [Micractinium tetrahymenae]
MPSRWLAAAALLLAAAAAAGAERTEQWLQQWDFWLYLNKQPFPRPLWCSNCGEDGHCRCPFGRIGKACEIDFLAPCRQAPEADAHCGLAATKSCECWRRCREYFCVQTDFGQKCHEFENWDHRPCFHREGLPPDQQHSRFPEPDEQGVKCLEGYFPEAKEVDCSEAAVFRNDVTKPLSACPNECSKRGFCMTFKDGAFGAQCRCDRGYHGASCESEQQNVCYKKCKGRGKCIDQFCHCDPPYFSIGCTRSKVYPANYSRPSPVDFKIYMYELSAQWAYDNVRFAGWQGHDPIYIAYQRFMEQFLDSAVCTEDPSAASMFYIPAFTYSYSDNGGIGNDHLAAVIHHIKHSYPYWNRTGGRDHFFWTPADRGACHLSGEPMDAVKITHFGSTATPDNHGTMPPYGHRGERSLRYGCAHPLRDVVAVPVQPWDKPWLDRTRQMTLDEFISGKKRMFFFAGGVRHQDPEYSGFARQLLHNLTREWNDPAFEFVEGGVPDYEQRLRSTKFCLAAYGHGWGNRLLQAMMTGCVPVIVQEHVLQFYEDVLPYELFSIRLNNADLPQLREILRSVTDEQYRRLLENVLRYHRAFSWTVEAGGQAFEYTILSLRRKYLNLKSLYYGRYSHLQQENCQPWTPEGCKPSTATS